MSDRSGVDRVEIFTAPWVIPVERPPIEGGGLAVSQGRIRSVGRASDLRREWSHATTVELDGCALLPTLVNAHTHLELTALGAVPGATDFVDWVLGVIAEKKTATADVYRQGIREGARACLEGGQGVVADILSALEAWPAYPRGAPDVLVFPELIAQRADLVEGALARALAAEPSGGSPAGLSPHTPYTACSAAYRACHTEVVQRRGLLVTHVAESPDELAFCLHATGPLLNRLYANLPAEPPPSPGVHPLEWLDAVGVLDRQTILVHMVQLRPQDVDLIARREARTVLCPRSNRRLGVGTAPGRALIGAGIEVGLGTDSALSAGDLDLWRDVACAVEDYGWSPAEAVRAATLGGARVFGLGKDRGAFAPGRRADILALPLTPGRELWDRVLSASTPVAVWLGGSPLVQRPGFEIPSQAR